MQTLFFLLFCFAVGYVCLWVLVNEHRGSIDGDWGLLAMRKHGGAEPEQGKRQPDPPPPHRGWKP